MLVIGAIANDGGEWRTMVVENGSREGRVERDLASASLLLFVCCCCCCLLFVVARLVSRRGTEPSAQWRVHS